MKNRPKSRRSTARLYGTRTLGRARLARDALRQLAGRQQPGDRASRSRPADVKALRARAAQVAQAVEALGRLDALGDHLEPEAACQVRGRAHDRGVRVVVREVADEHAVDL